MQTGRRSRNLVVQRIPAQELEQVFGAGSDPTHFAFLPMMAGYEEWAAVSHTSEIRAAGEAIVTILFELPA